MTTQPFLLGSGAGFSGDRIDAAIPVVAAIAAAERGGAIIFETLGERTLALGQVARQADPEKGYEPLLEQFLGPILAPAIEAGITIVGNFGAANPPAAARAIARLAAAQGLAPRIAIVTGDDMLNDPAFAESTLWEGDSGLLTPSAAPIAVNVYLGARSIADAIRAGAQIVVTGRVADPALALGPLVAHFGWDWDDLDRLAAGTLIGHLLECGSQVSGGYFADPGIKDVPDMARIDFPIAEVSFDGAAVLTKPPATGGRLDIATVTEQLLYEIHDPAAYLTPDVTLDVTGVRLEQSGKDRVRVTGARGRPAPDRLKATVSYPGEWLGEAGISYAGPNALARAELAVRTIRERLAIRGLSPRLAEVEASRETQATRADKGATGPAPKRTIGNLPAALPRIEEVIEPASLICPCGCGVASVARTDGATLATAQDRRRPQRAAGHRACPAARDRHRAPEVCLPVLHRRGDPGFGTLSPDHGRPADRGDARPGAGQQICRSPAAI